MVQKGTGETRRFDADGNGEIDLSEWEQAREVARQEVAQAILAFTALAFVLTVWLVSAQR